MTDGDGKMKLDADKIIYLCAGIFLGCLGGLFTWHIITQPVFDIGYGIVLAAFLDITSALCLRAVFLGHSKKE